MAGNNKLKTKRNSTKRKANPLATQQTRIPRPRLSFDGQVLDGTGYFSPVTTGGLTANISASVYTIDISNLTFSGFGMTQASVAVDLLAISKLYNEYVYHSVTMHWIPAVPPGTNDGASQIYISYLDNPEAIAGTIASVLPAPVFNIAKTARNSRFFNAWERYTYNVPLSRRRKSFDTNVNSLQSTDTIDRSAQGAIICGYASNSATATLGQWRVTYQLELRNLNVNLAT